jgi:hypothetical protein
MYLENYKHLLLKKIPKKIQNFICMKKYFKAKRHAIIL